MYVPYRSGMDQAADTELQADIFSKLLQVCHCPTAFDAAKAHDP